MTAAIQVTHYTSGWVRLSRKPEPPMHRHHDRVRPSQNGGIAHVRGQVRRARDGHYVVSVINTATGEVLNSDSPFCCLAEAVTEAGWRTQAVREAWSMSLLKKWAGKR